MGDVVGSIYGGGMITANRRVLITDLDNTLWDWFDAWYRSFDALLNGLVDTTGLDRRLLERQIRDVHRSRGTTEYSNLVREVPALVEYVGARDAFEVFDNALHAQNSSRKRSTKLYPGVAGTLRLLKSNGVQIIAYTESGAYWTEWRIRNTGLDGVIDVLYSSPDHDIVAGTSLEKLRTGRYEGSYGLKGTEHIHVPMGVTKPNSEVLTTILREQRCAPQDAVYVGDSLIKDIAMAQAVGVLDVHAAYGQAHWRPEYDLLRRVTHWSDEDVAREKALSTDSEEIAPSLTCRTGLRDVLPVFGVSRELV